MISSCLPTGCECIEGYEARWSTVYSRSSYCNINSSIPVHKLECVPNTKLPGWAIIAIAVPLSVVGSPVLLYLLWISWFGTHEIPGFLRVVNHAQKRLRGVPKQGESVAIVVTDIEGYSGRWASVIQNWSDETTLRAGVNHAVGVVCKRFVSCYAAQLVLVVAAV